MSEKKLNDQELKQVAGGVPPRVVMGVANPDDHEYKSPRIPEEEVVVGVPVRPVKE